MILKDQYEQHGGIDAVSQGYVSTTADISLCFIPASHVTKILTRAVNRW